jgi:hypothetical protein
MEIMWINNGFGSSGINRRFSVVGMRIVNNSDPDFF